MRPSFDPVFAIRSVLILVLSSAIILGLFPLPLRCVKPRPSRAFGDAELLLFGAAMIIFYAVYLVLYRSPYSFYIWALEDAAVENLSVALLAACVGLHIGTYIRGREKNGWLLLTAVVLFAGMMEELSWFQRAVGIEAPRFMHRLGNSQTNIHNLATNEIETLTYFAFFLLLVLVPFANLHSSLFASFPQKLRNLIPDERAMFFALPFTAIEIQMWNALPAQIAFFCAVLICVRYVFELKDIKSKVVIGLFAAVLIIVQYLFLGSYFRLGRKWDPTEYKELFIYLALTVYSARLFIKARG